MWVLKLHLRFTIDGLVINIINRVRTVMTYSIIQQGDTFAIFSVVFEGNKAITTKLAYNISSLARAARIVMYLHITSGNVERAIKLAQG